MTEISRNVIQKAFEFSVDLMTEMGEFVRARSDGGFAIHRKADGSLVTEVDLLVEREIRDRIRTRWPDHSIEGEEDGLESRSSEYRWLVDPIDGTMSFRHGVPLLGTILALIWRNRSAVGVINLPGLRRCYSAGRGLGTHLNGRRLQLSDVAADEISGELMAVGDRQQFERAGLAGCFDALMSAHSWVRTYTDCFGTRIGIKQ